MDFPKLERKILNFWEKNQIFKKSISKRRGRPYFSFYDGPPFATGKPHYGHILATTIKDTVLRYWTMRGYQVPRRVGWDCHGLPVENLIEKEMGIKNKKGIEKLGIEKFNLSCRSVVFRCVNDFEKTLRRVGRWADYKNSYATLDPDYIESVWWVFKKIWDMGLVYKDYRVSPYCPRCGTPLSNFEVNLGYKEVKDNSVYLRFRIKGPEFKDIFFLVWTTTPWTLPANLALAVNPEIQYLLIEKDKKRYILAGKRKKLLEGGKVLKKFSGKKLLGLKYEPLFDFLFNKEVKEAENAFSVLPADFVSDEEGTGVVHIAPMYGDDDFQLGKKFNLPLIHTLDLEGRFKKMVSDWSGLFAKEADPLIIKKLEEKSLLYKEEKVLHSYPFCWRCDSPLLYYALECWYIAVSKIKKQLIANNKKIRWVPGHIKEGRFGKWLLQARDWAFSRNRFWGAPLPIWQCQSKKGENKGCGNVKVVGSFKELEKIVKRKIKDPHRPYIDEIEFNCPKCGGKMKRTPEVFDCWFESGSMPYAQWHYPFENKRFLEKTFPADFIAEGLDQTRGWFYTLHVIATILTLKDIGLGKNRPAFLNVIVNGLVLDEKGRKLSKKLGNYPEPKEIFDRYGADALRYFLLTSTPIGQDYRFSEKGVQDTWRRTLLTLWNSYLFFETYKEKGFSPKKRIIPKNVLNRWIISRLEQLKQEVIFEMERYEITKAARKINSFLEDLSNWYIRRSRDYFKKPKQKREKDEFSQTLYYLLKEFLKISAPFLPFISEYLYLELREKKEPQSVHLSDFPKPKKNLIDGKLEEKMRLAREIAAKALAKRAKAGIKVRQPLLELQINKPELKKEKELLNILKEELNVKKITFGRTLKLNTKITPELKEEGLLRELSRQIQQLRKKARLKPKDKIFVYYFASAQLKKPLEKNKKLFVKEAQIKDIIFEKKAKKDLLIEKEVSICEKKIWIGLKKTKN